MIRLEIGRNFNKERLKLLYILQIIYIYILSIHAKWIIILNYIKNQDLEFQMDFVIINNIYLRY